MTYQLENEFENLLLIQLENQGYEKVEIIDEEGLKNNFRTQLSNFNNSKLNGVPLTDKEFNRVFIYLEGKSIFNSAKILRDKYVLEREDGSKIYLDFFDSKNFNNNIFQVSNQITMKNKYKNRYDVTILINGLPIVQIELKRRGKDFGEAFKQIERYRRHSFKGLFRYVQCFVISNGVDTKYYANSDKEIKPAFTFFWSDEKNNRITNLKDFAESFLNRRMLNNIIGKYIIINESEKNLMVMRPYQIYAVEALINRAKETNNNGYIWHTTGSGKTLTSFKASQLLADEKDIKKVFFLIDRKDLDTQTVEEFNKFEKDCVDTTDNVRTLLKQIEDINKRLIVTTIQKLARLLKSNKYANKMDKYRNDKVVFIIDECHRSQFGEMHTVINKHFINAQYFGFTGTPRLLENKSQDGRTTADIFDKSLHSYLIKDAINDGNVLGFSVEYIKTIKDNFDDVNDEYIKAINKDEAFMNNIRIENIAKDIIKNHDKKTYGRKFCSLLTVQSIPMLVKYYDTFKYLEHDLKIAAVFSYDDNENLEGKSEHSRESLERIINDYNNMFKEENLDFSTDKSAEYFKSLSKKLKNAELDIVIVVNMFLTGFDSKPLNTLYVDRNLNYHGLLQAFSRTNRVLDSTKQHGNIVCYRNLKNETDEAIRVFSDSDNTDVVLMKSFDYYLNLFKEKLDRLYEIAPTIQSIDSMQDEVEKKEFVEAFRDLTSQLTKLKTFVDFEFTEENIGMSEQKYEDYKSKYFAIYDSVKAEGKEKTSILNDIDFCIELMHTDKINVHYILNLLRDIDFDSKKKTNSDVEKIKKLLENASDEDLRLKSELIREFLDKVIPNLTKDDSIDETFNNFIEFKREDEINNFSNDIEIDKVKMQEYVSEYEFSGRIDGSAIKDNLSGGLLKKKRLSDRIKTFILDHVKKFSF
ncbi:type I restriction endonuclease subunit R [Clostridium perfringens]|nr:type I restriction endonuclease subunit R [Clostridium perfringens]